MKKYWGSLSYLYGDDTRGPDEDTPLYLASEVDEKVAELGRLIAIWRHEGLPVSTDFMLDRLENVFQ